MKTKNTSTPETQVKFGEFPFPLIEGPEESRYVTWLRNHSNYMAERGFLDYLRSVAVLVRGILLNFLIFVPPLLVVALVLGFAHDLMHEHPFLLTRCVLLFALLWTLLFLLIIPLFKIARHKHSLETGSDSSVKLRDRYERSFGACLLAILIAVTVESLPHGVDFFHRFRTEQLVWQEFFSLAAVLAVLSGANKLLDVLGGVAKKVAMFFIGALGLLFPLLVILYVTEFLLYGRMPQATAYLILLVPAVGVGGILLALIVGLWQRAFGRVEVLQLFGLLISGLVLTGSVFVVLRVADYYAHELTARRMDFADNLSKLTQGFDEMVEARKSAGKKPGDNLTRLTASLQNLVIRERQQFNELETELNKEANDLDQTYEYFERVELLLKAFDEELNKLDSAEREELREQLGNLAQRELDRRRNLLKLTELANVKLDTTNLQDLDELTQAQLAGWTPAQRERLSRWFDKVAEGFLRLDTRDQHQLRAEFIPLAKQLANLTPEQRTPERLVGMAAGFAELREELVNLPAELGRALKELPELEASDALAIRLYGELADLVPGEGRHELAKLSYIPKALFVLVLGIVIWLACWLTVDVNLTSIHGLYRDRLASAFLVGEDTRGDVDIEEDIDLHDICCYEAGSTAPYHLVNVALNLQGSSDIGVRDRQSDFFIFSKRFIGGNRTGYCRSKTMEQVYPQIDLAAAMAISAAAASPNMGRETSPALVAFMTLLNVRLGYWLPNPGLLEEILAGRGKKRKRRRSMLAQQPPGFSFAEVFEQELNEIEMRRAQAYPPDHKSIRPLGLSTMPTIQHGLVGIGFSGGGIRSATLNLGIAQALHRAGVFDHLDLMSTVSGGGYLGSSISTLMRCKTRQSSEIAGTVSLESTEQGDQIVHISGDELEEHEYRFWITDELLVKDGDMVKALDPLIGRCSEIDGVVSLEVTKTERIISVTETRKYQCTDAAKLDSKIKNGATIRAGDVLAEAPSGKVTCDMSGTVTLDSTKKGPPVIRVSREVRYPCSLDDRVLVAAGDRVNIGDVLLEHPTHSAIAGAVNVETKEGGEQVVRVKGPRVRKYRYAPEAELRVKTGDRVSAGDRLIRRPGPKLRSEVEGIVKAERTETGKEVVTVGYTKHARYEYSRYDALQVKTGDWVNPGDWLLKRWNSLGERFRWRVPPIAFLREMRSKLDEKHSWVNLSDGGHIENLATIELLRRRCEFIIIGDGEADPKHHFKGVATLIRTARIDLGIDIKIDLQDLRLKKKRSYQEENDDGYVCDRHWAMGTIIYPEKDKNGNHEIGHLLYLKSSFTGKEGEVIQQYRRRNPDFPHQSTADQFFDEGQFEAYRALGQEVGEQVLKDYRGKMSYSEFRQWFLSLADTQPEYKELTLAELQAQLRSRSLKISGKKAELIARLNAADAEAARSAAVTAGSESTRDA